MWGASSPALPLSSWALLPETRLNRPRGISPAPRPPQALALQRQGYPCAAWGVGAWPASQHPSFHMMLDVQ